MDKVGAVVLLFASGTIAAAPAQAVPVAVAAERPRAADDFVDSIGVNVHLHYDNTPYNARYTAFAPLLEATGIRHLRDGLIDTTYQPYYDRLNELGRAGIHADLITSIGQTPALLRAYPSRVPDAIEAYEGPNEYDSHQSEAWADQLKAFMQTVYAAAKSGPRAFPVIGPSVMRVDSFDVLGDLSPWLDYGNLHNYFGGFNPGTRGWGSARFGSHYGSIRYHLAALAQVSSRKPVITTETGYCTDLERRNSVPVTVQARYVPRMFLEQFNAGIVRTYEYEFADEGGGDFNACGLATSSLQLKPAYYALSGLIHTLSDRGTPFALKPLSYGLSGNLADVHHTLLQKRDGTYYLVLWVERPCWDVNAHAAIAVSPQSIALQLRSVPKFARVSHFDDAGKMTTGNLVLNRTTAQLNVTDRVSIVALKFSKI